MSDKRADYLSWDEYFMGVASLASKRSKDPNTQVGACIVDRMPLGCSDDEFPWDRSGGTLDSKYAYVTHAELNAVLNSKTADLEGDTVYTTLFPCNECTKALIQKKVGRIVYLDDKYHDTETAQAARRMLDAAGIKYEKYDNSGREIKLDL